MKTEILEPKLKLQKKIEEWIDEISVDDHPFGWFGDNAVSLMTDAAFNIVLASADVQSYMEREGAEPLKTL